MWLGLGNKATLLGLGNTSPCLGLGSKVACQVFVKIKVWIKIINHSLTFDFTWTQTAMFTKN